MTDPGTERGAPSQYPGWYPDPWTTGYHRYWDGTAWTSDAFPNGPSAPADRPSPGEEPAAAAAADGPSRTRATASGLGFVALVVALMLVVGSLAVVGGYYAFGRRSTSGPEALPPVPVPSGPSTVPTLPVPTIPPDPSASVLAGLVVTQADVGGGGFVVPRPSGDQLSDATLDLCQGSFPSEALRTARLQVDVLTDIATIPLSTEAVLYANPSATAQAFSELTSVASACPPPTKLNPVPDGGWPQVPTVDRLAFDFTTTNPTGTSHNVSVYLRRGRVLEAVYFYLPAAEHLTVAGQTTLAGITNVFATRIAQLPASVVGG
jgi:hypothetical protein